AAPVHTPAPLRGSGSDGRPRPAPGRAQGGRSCGRRRVRRVPLPRPVPTGNRSLPPRDAGARGGPAGAERSLPRHSSELMARVGLMLYTVRDECARDFEGTLRAVAELGYEGVELFDLHGHDPAELRGWLDELGLPVCGRHASLEAIEARLPE